jgi:hypothetical protein
MNNRQSGSTTGLAVLAVFALLGGTGLFLYKTVLVDSGIKLPNMAWGSQVPPAPAPASPPAAPDTLPTSPAPESSPSPSASPSPVAAPSAPAIDAPASAAPKPGSAASSPGRAPTGVRGAVAGEGKQAKDEAAKWMTLQSNLQSLRSQIQLYRLQHNDNYPDFRAYPKWEQLVRLTYADGTFVDENALPALEGARKMGPYFGSVPVNPLNGSVEVAAVDGELNAGDSITPAGPGKVGYAFSIADGKLYVTDATGRRVADVERMVVGQKVTAPAGKEEVRRALVQTLRSQLMLYKLQHQDELPDFNRFPNWEQLLKKTDADGSVSRKAMYGPYLVDKPVNPSNGFSAVEVVNTPPDALHKAGANIGWVVDTRTGRLWATDEEANVIIE